MKYCVNCFADRHIREKIVEKGEKGDCSFCGSQNVWVGDISSNTVKDILYDVIQLYEEEENRHSLMLAYALINDWDIFHLDVEKTQILIHELFSDDDRIIHMLTHPVWLPHLYDAEYQADYGIVGGMTYGLLYH